MDNNLLLAGTITECHSTDGTLTNDAHSEQRSKHDACCSISCLPVQILQQHFSIKALLIL
jgi:hypothetical protein